MADPPRQAPQEFVYENPPLREVIVEYRWTLTSLKVVEGVRIDPFYPVVLQNFTGEIAKAGFGVVESRVPDDAPIELFAHQPTRMFRLKPNAWPIFQIGPGIFTANATPPYGGWSSFLPHVRSGLDHLFKIYPSEFLNPESISLRYVNGFVASHGMSSQAAFIRNGLRLVAPLPESIVRTAEGGGDNIIQTGRARINLTYLPGARGEIVWNTGRVKAEQAVILELRMQTPASTMKSSEDVCSTLNKSHELISNWFEALISEDVRKHFGNRKEVQK